VDPLLSRLSDRELADFYLAVIRVVLELEAEGSTRASAVRPVVLQIEAELYRRVLGWVRCYLRSHFRDLDDSSVDDVANETCLRVWERLRESVLPPVGSFREYAMTVARNFARRLLAPRHRHVPLPDDHPAPDPPDPPDDACTKCNEKFVALLKERDRKIWENSLAEKPLSSAELGSQIGMKADTVRKAFENLKKRFRSTCDRACK